MQCKTNLQTIHGVEKANFTQINNYLRVIIGF